VHRARAAAGDRAVAAAAPLPGLQDAAGARAQLLDAVGSVKIDSWPMRISAASRSAAVGSIEPSVSMSSVSLS
jgi:hypothetical protein